MGNKTAPGSPATMPPGETHRRKRHGAVGTFNSKSDNHASNAKSRKKARHGERAMERARGL